MADRPDRANQNSINIARKSNALLKNESTQQFIAKRYNTTEANLHNWLKKNSPLWAFLQGAVSLDAAQVFGANKPASSLEFGFDAWLMAVSMREEQ